MLILYIMIFKLLEIISRYYYKISNIIESYSFIEKKITPINEYPLFFNYYYYIFCYYFEKLCYIKLINRNNIKHYEVIYTENNIKRAAIINGCIFDVFEYTRHNKTIDKLNFIFKYNYILNGIKTNIRNIIKKYDTKTKLYDVVYFNFYNDIIKSDIDNLIEVEIGNKLFNVREMDKDLLIEDV